MDEESLHHYLKPQAYPPANETTLRQEMDDMQAAWSSIIRLLNPHADLDGRGREEIAFLMQRVMHGRCQHCPHQRP